MNDLEIHLNLLCVSLAQLKEVQKNTKNYV